MLTCSLHFLSSLLPPLIPFIFTSSCFFPFSSISFFSLLRLPLSSPSFPSLSFTSIPSLLPLPFPSLHSLRLLFFSPPLFFFSFFTLYVLVRPFLFSPSSLSPFPFCLLFSSPLPLCSPYPLLSSSPLLRFLSFPSSLLRPSCPFPLFPFPLFPLSPPSAPTTTPFPSTSSLGLEFIKTFFLLSPMQVQFFLLWYLYYDQYNYYHYHHYYCR